VDINVYQDKRLVYQFGIDLDLENILDEFSLQVAVIEEIKSRLSSFDAFISQLFELQTFTPEDLAALVMLREKLSDGIDEEYASTAVMSYFANFALLNQRYLDV
jgi:hypothetical protein